MQDCKRDSDPPEHSSREEGAAASQQVAYLGWMERVFASERLAAVRETKLLDSAAEEAFDRLTRLAARLLDSPVALFSLIDADRQFLKSVLGLGEPWCSSREAPLSQSLCKYVVAGGQTLSLPDARADAFFAQTSAVAELGVIAYLGVPVVNAEGQALGVFCVNDNKPHQWSAEEIGALEDLAVLAATEIELRAQLRARATAELRHAEQSALVEAIVNGMDDGVVVCDTSGRVVLSNDAARRSRTQGVMESNAALASFGVFLPDGKTPLLLEQTPSARALRGEHVHDFELVMRLPGEPERWQSVHASPLYAADGSIRGSVSVGRDVTAVKRATQAVAESERRYRLIAENLPNTAVVLFDNNLRVLLADGEQLLRAMGLTKASTEGRFLYDLVPKEQRPDVEARYNLALAGEERSYTLERSGRWLAIHIAPVYGERGEIVGGMSMCYDLTALKQAEAALEEQKIFFQATLESMSEGVMMMNMDGDFVVFNGAAAEFFGGQTSAQWSADWITRLQICESDGETPFDPAHDPLDRALRGEASTGLHWVVPNQNEGQRHLRVTGRPVRDQVGALLGGVIVMHDITAQTKAERLAHEEASQVELLHFIAQAANTSENLEEAFRTCLRRVCEFTGWELAHVYLRRGDQLVPSNWWHGQESQSWHPLIAATREMRFTPGVGLIGKVFASQSAEWTLDTSDSAAFLRADAAQAVGMKSALGFPVCVAEEVVAVLEFFSHEARAPEPRWLSMMQNVSVQLGRLTERDQAKRLLESQAEAIRAMALRDELTGLYNRRGFLELAERELAEAIRCGRPLTLFFADLNGMKIINDELGHDAGDRALADAADVLRSTFGAFDIIARLGGDEFVALALDANEARASSLCERFRQELEQTNGLPNRSFRLSVSLGNTRFDPAHPESLEVLLARADGLMYEQKRRRRTAPFNSIPILSRQQ